MAEVAFLLLVGSPAADEMAPFLLGKQHAPVRRDIMEVEGPGRSQQTRCTPSIETARSAEDCRVSPAVNHTSSPPGDQASPMALP